MLCGQVGAKCHNDQEKRTIAEKIVESLVQSSALPATKSINTAIQTILSDSRVKDLIEFSRAVQHAEMHAILGPSRVAGGADYRWKFHPSPCTHAMLVQGTLSLPGSGKLDHIEPYRKSLATKLHSDALTEAIDTPGRVKLLQFDGVAPSRLHPIFLMPAFENRRSEVLH